MICNSRLEISAVQLHLQDNLAFKQSCCCFLVTLTFTYCQPIWPWVSGTKQVCESMSKSSDSTRPCMQESETSLLLQVALCAKATDTDLPTAQELVWTSEGCGLKEKDASQTQKSHGTRKHTHASTHTKKRACTHTKMHNQLNWLFSACCMLSMLTKPGGDFNNSLLSDNLWDNDRHWDANLAKDCIFDCCTTEPEIPQHLLYTSMCLFAVIVFQWLWLISGRDEPRC